MQEYGACAAQAQRPAAPRRELVALAVFISVLAVATLVLAASPETWMGSPASLLAAPAKSEKGLVTAAMHATRSFADHDVTAAVLKAQQQAKAAYEKMMGSALKVEAKAHKEGQEATEQALASQASAEQQRIDRRRMRAMRDEQLQARKDASEQHRMVKELDRSLGTRVIEGV
eukprot:CAMPEP_0181314746 /NCGR_PEP_ID=MMETSP1101-20121128/14987_1 /TAXON_ID=46948 /ORGANISM="Rhodomonas abbreviata, Strain Caron Lab Isolate" /LENGTH=172 /DNA_ID=CAMNT_0023421869 /DNA_START=314 /DNA_END=832 /DNA_ORIENTATION=+